MSGAFHVEADVRGSVAHQQLRLRGAETQSQPEFFDFTVFSKRSNKVGITCGLPEKKRWVYYPKSWFCHRKLMVL